MAKITVSANEILADIKADMDDTGLMQKYGLSDKGLRSVLKKLVDEGVLKQGELDKRKTAAASAMDERGEQPNESVPSPQDVSVEERRSATTLNYRLYAMLCGIGFMVVLAGLFVFENYRHPHKVETPRGIEDAVIRHYSSDQGAQKASGFRLSNVRVLRVSEGRLTEEMKKETKEDRLFCASFVADVLEYSAATKQYQQRKDLNPSLFNVVVFRAYSGRLRGTILQDTEILSGENCPGDWDHICPFTCDEYKAQVAQLRQIRQRAFAAEEVRQRRLEDFVGAAFDGNLNRVTQFVSEGVDVNGLNTNGKTALILASAAGRVDVVNLLLTKGADINAKDREGKTALMTAFLGAHLNVVNLLLTKAADVNPKDKDDVAALMLASFGGRADVVNLLLAKGADINAKDKIYRVTALIFASFGGHVDVVNLLLAKGADINAKGEADGVTALMLASFGGRVDLVNLLLAKGADINAKDREGKTALRWAYAAGHVDVVKLFVAKGADVNAKDEMGWTALILASAAGHMDLVNLLLDKGADVNAKDKDGETALMSASREGRVDVVNLLLTKGADINAKDREGKTALMTASSKGHQEVVDLLKMHGAQ